MLWSFCVLLACQAFGEVLRAVTGLPIPGTILGLGLLLAGLQLTGGRFQTEPLPAPDALLPYLGLLFVPPGVVAVLKLGTLGHAWLPIAAGILVSSVFTLVVGGLVAQRLLARDASRTSRDEVAAPVRPS